MKKAKKDWADSLLVELYDGKTLINALGAQAWFLKDAK